MKKILPHSLYFFIFASAIFLKGTSLTSETNPYYMPVLSNIIQMIILSLFIYIFLFNFTNLKESIRLLPLIFLVLLNLTFYMTDSQALSIKFYLLYPIIYTLFLWLAFVDNSNVEKYIRIIIVVSLIEALVGVWFFLNGSYIPHLYGVPEWLRYDEAFWYGGNRITGFHTVSSSFHLQMAYTVVAISLCINSGRKFWLLLLSVSVLILSKGKSSTAAALVFLLGKFIYEKFGKRMLIAYIIFTSLFSIYFIYEFSIEYGGIFSGRLHFWNYTIRFLEDNLLLGNMGKDFLIPTEEHIYGEINYEFETWTHNLFLYFLSKYGLLFFIIMIFQVILIMRVSPMMLLYIEFLSIIAFFQINFFRGPTIFDLFNVLLIIYISSRYKGLDIGEFLSFPRLHKLRYAIN